MISEHRLDDCNSLWARLAESLSNVSAYQFYCQPNDTKRHQLIASVANYVTLSHYADTDVDTLLKSSNKRA